ncbi:MAG: Rrf2 family transcriptional regulator [Gammaproteobacteria bacterium]|nr:Rrf2 family transcriptional regulator [Gammaproteobacteria bacterium]MCW8922771.1 Rrf2 family transcriptional regulator [Gammaproteobacteria bacterium]
MRLTTKGRYAVTAVLDLAFHQEKGPVSLAAISERQDISLSYLEQLFSKLRRNDIVVSTRGPGGGYSLKRPTDEISVSSIIMAVDESVKMSACDAGEGCQNVHRCLTHDLWQDLSNEIKGFLDGITLAGMMENKRVKEVSIRQDSISSDADAAA